MTFRVLAIPLACILFFLNAVKVYSQTKKQPVKAIDLNDPAAVFLNPPPAAKPGVLWMWMGSNLSKAGITKDLEALKKEGFNRTTMFSLSDITTPWSSSIGKSPTPQLLSWTEPWWEMVRHAALESKRLGMDFGTYNGPGYESSGGPWVTPELSMQEVCWSKVNVSGNTSVKIKLAKPVVKLQGHTPFPIYNPETGVLSKPDVAARGTYYKDIRVLALPVKGIVPLNQVINITDKMQPDGTLNWDAPAGEWTIYRFGHTTTGTLIQPAPWKATGLECDKMSQEAIGFHMDHVVGEIKKHVGDLIGTGFTHVHFDSFEAGNATWTPKMAEEFKNRRGYDLTPYMATLAGRVVGNSKSDSLKFMNDFNATIKDLYRDVYFKTIAQKLKDANLKFLCEPYGGPWRQDEILPLVPNVMTEFWTHGGNYSPYELDPTVAALRKSGQNIIEAEAFTGDSKESKWSETPVWLKPIGDAAFCAGVNRMVLHRFVQQPWDDKYKPGATMGRWGTHFDRTQTWWEPAKALVEYWQRCQALLQWGNIAGYGDKDDVMVTGNGNTKAIKFIHRKTGDTDIYFVANTAREANTANCSFKVTGKQPELWDPVTKSMRNLTAYVTASGRMNLPITFDAAQSFFIVFKKKLSATQPVAKANFTPPKQVLIINGAWQVKFDETWGGPKSAVTFSALEDWTKRPEAGIKYYSGTAAYNKTFDVSAKLKQGNLYLDLGTVNHLASVSINGINLGIAWTAPWQIKVPAGLLKPKGNKLMIKVTNVWANRLIGDEQEPKDAEWLPGTFNDGEYMKEFPEWFLKNQPRPSKGRYCFTTWNYFTKDSPLISSGLLGPVRILTKE